MIGRQHAEENTKTKHPHPAAVELSHSSTRSDESVVSPSGTTPEKELAERKRPASQVTIKALQVHRASRGIVIAGSAAKEVTTHAPHPYYPEEARSHRVGGSGVCVVSVDPVSGSVTNVSMAESTGSLLLDRSVLRTLRTWKFKPGTVSQVNIPVEFTTEDENR